MTEEHILVRLTFGRGLVAGSIIASLISLATNYLIGNDYRSVSQRLRDRQAYELRVEDVLGQEAPERFYEIDGERVFLEIDGMPVAEYVGRVRAYQEIFDRMNLEDSSCSLNELREDVVHGKLN